VLEGIVASALQAKAKLELLPSGVRWSLHAPVHDAGSSSLAISGAATAVAERASALPTEHLKRVAAA
jgi:hypothetical protein